MFVFQYYSQYEEQLLGKLQYIEQQSVQAALATETKIGQCETQIKATEGKLESLRGKIAQLLLNQNPVSGAILFSCYTIIFQFFYFMAHRMVLKWSHHTTIPQHSG